MMIVPTKRNIKKFQVENLSLFLHKALLWGSGFSHCTYYCPNDLPYLFQPFIHFIAVEAASTFTVSESNNFENLKNYHHSKNDWLVGNFSYDLKNEIENLTSNNSDTIGFKTLSFFQPKHLLFFDKNSVEIHSFEDPEILFKLINNTSDHQEDVFLKSTPIKPKISKKKYIETVHRIREEIISGEVYELNYCMEFFGKEKSFNPLAAFRKLNSLSPMPFAAFQKIKDKYLICASPERFLKKEGSMIISQPIKGTSGRGETKEEDEIKKLELQNSEKERAENMMIVDLVRNDLAKSSIPGSTKVKELFGIYSYKNVHQMVSTVVSQSKPDYSFTDIIKNAFPMGSMTGAPKVSAMKLIEEIEATKRGVFSGAAGYITPLGDFDFNVVIRSLLYNQSTGNLSFQVGSAITYDSVPEKEYEECLLKAEALLALFKNS